MDPHQFGRVIRDRRGHLNMTQPELADRAGVTLAYICMLEAGGVTQPGLAPLERLATVLGFHRLADLLGDVARVNGGATLPPSVEELAIGRAVDQFLRELHTSA